MSIMGERAAIAAVPFFDECQRHLQCEIRNLRIHFYSNEIIIKIPLD